MQTRMCGGSAAGSLGQVGVGNEAVVSALLEALHDADSAVRRRAAESLGQVGAGNEAVVSALLRPCTMQTRMCGRVRQRAWGDWKSRIQFNCARYSWPSTVACMMRITMCVGLPWYPSVNCWMADQSPATDGCRCGNDERGVYGLSVSQFYQVLLLSFS